MTKWMDEFQPSVLTKAEQKAELDWFEKAAMPYKGMTIKVVSEGIFEGQYVLYHFAKSKEYRYDHKRLTIVKIMDIIAIAEVDSEDIVSEPITADSRWCAEGVNTCGLPEIEDYRGEK